MAKRKDKPTPINREKFLNNLHDSYQIPEQVEQPYNNSNPDAKYRKPGEPEFLRANEISMKGDTNNVINITLEDHDEAILYYIKNVIKPTVEINGNQQEVPVVYGSPERWKSMQKDGFFRDKNGKAFIPIIAVKRESFEKDRRLGNKLDGNKVQNVQYFKTGYSKRNGYDNFSVLQNQKPAEEYQVGVIPDYITVTYKLSIFTDYVEHMNSIIEAIEFASDSYWGDKERFNFRASITQFPTPTEVVNGNDRAVKSDLTLTINGYIVPKSINVQKAAPSPKSYNVTKFVFKEFAQESTTPQIDKDGNRVITYTNPSSNNVSYFGTFNGTFIGDGSGLTNLPIPIIDTGSLLLTSSFNEFTSSYTTGSFTGSFIGDGSGLTNLPVPVIDTGSLVTTSSFNNFTSSYTTGSFNGLFEGTLLGTSSYSQNSSTASYYEEKDPTFQASEASLFVAGDKANLDNQSGVNTGDETTSSIQTKRPLKTVNNQSLEGSGNIQIDYSDLNNLPTLITLHGQLTLDDGTNPHNTTKSDVGLGNVDNTSDINKPISTATQTALNNKLDKVTTVDVEKVYIKNADGSQGTKATSDFKDVLEFANLSAFPATGESGKIYLALNTNLLYRWSGSVYVQLSSGIDFPSDGKIYGVKDGVAIQIENKRVFKYLIRATGTGVTYYGANPVSVTGTASNTNEIFFGGGVSFYQIATASTAGSFCEIRESSFRRKDKIQTGNFSMLMFFNANGSSNYRCFGGSSDVSVMGNINPTTYSSYHFGIGADDTDSNYQLMYGDSSGGRTKIDLGWAKTGKKFFYLHLFQDTPYGNTEVLIVNLSDKLIYSNTIAHTFHRSYRLWCGNSIDAISVGAGVNFIELNVNF